MSSPTPMMTVTNSPYERLHPYQCEGVDFLASRDAAILGDDVGLGKTVQAIRAVIAAGAYPVLVITRKSLVHQWVQHIEEWSRGVGPEPRITVLGTKTELPPRLPQQPGAWFVINYEAARIRQDSLRRQWGAVILDEAQTIKNRKAKVTKAAWHIAKGARHVWLLTATPIRNRPDELWSLLRCIDPDNFTSYWKWVERFCYVTHTGYGVEVVGLREDRRNLFSQTIAPYFLRRERSEILDLPPLTEETVWVTLEGAQRKAYREMETQMLTLVGDETRPDLLIAENVLSQLIRLRQLATCPEVLGAGEGAKTRWLRENLPDLMEDHQVLLFTSFAQYAHVLGRGDADQYTSWPVAWPLTGDMSATERRRTIRYFHNGAVRAIVGTYGAMGTGLNLQDADIVILLDLPWTPDDVEQAIGRAHRQGQRKPVHVIRLLADDTIDVDMLAVLSRKEQVVNQTLAAMMAIESMKERRS